MGVAGGAISVLAHKDHVVIFLVFIQKALPRKRGHHIPVQAAVFHQVGKHPPVVAVGRRQIKRSLHLLVGCADLGERFAVLSQQRQHRLRVVHPVKLLEEGYRPAACLGGVIVPLIASDGDAVVAAHAQLPPGGDKGFASAAEELGEVNQIGLLLLFVCEMDVGQNFHLVIAFLIFCDIL